MSFTVDTGQGKLVQGYRNLNCALNFFLPRVGTLHHQLPCETPGIANPKKGTHIHIDCLRLNGLVIFDSILLPTPADPNNFHYDISNGESSIVTLYLGTNSITYSGFKKRFSVANITTKLLGNDWDWQ